MKPVAVSEALSALEESQKASPTPRRYHAVISDCQMPEVDGYTLAKWIQACTTLCRCWSEDSGEVAPPRHQQVIPLKPVKYSHLFDDVASLFTVAPTREKRRAKPAPAPRAPAAADSVAA